MYMYMYIVYTYITIRAIVSSERHPPKKYYGAHFEAYSSTHDGQSHDEIGQPNRRTSEEAEYVDGETINWWNDRRDIIGNRNETHRPVQVSIASQNVKILSYNIRDSSAENCTVFE